MARRWNWPGGEATSARVDSISRLNFALSGSDGGMRESPALRAGGSSTRTMSTSDVVPIVSVASSAVVAVVGVVSSAITRRGDRTHEVKLRYEDWENGVRELRRQAYVDGLVYARAMAKTRDADSQARKPKDDYRVTAAIEVYGSSEAARLWQNVFKKIHSGNDVGAALDLFAKQAQHETDVVPPSKVDARCASGGAGEPPPSASKAPRHRRSTRPRVGFRISRKSR